jgi:solute carrier family 25 S-adenosylmethionine transporter 26
MINIYKSACTVRVPIEVLKQRMQVLQYNTGLISAIGQLYRTDGILGFYRGFQATIQREIPFATLQFPLYEYLKRTWRHREDTIMLTPWKAAICGSIAGGITAALTTPLDVIKTRIILSHKEDVKTYNSPLSSFRVLLAEGGVRRLFAGVGPRVVWISLGGFIFFGAYEKVKMVLEHPNRNRV